MISAEARKEKIVEAIKAGVDTYIVKPLTEAILLEKLEKLAQKKPFLKE